MREPTRVPRDVPQAARRAVALAVGAVPGETTEVACAQCGVGGSVNWPRRYSDGEPGAWVSFTGLELDHVKPVNRGGTHDPSNLQLLCRSCNLRKGRYG